MWTSDNEHCDKHYNDFKRVLGILEKMKTLKNPDMRFAADYMLNLINENRDLQNLKTNYFEQMNDAIFKRDIYKKYAHYLQNILKIKQPNRVEYLRKRFKVDSIEGGK